jgi:hypothetical protein
MRRPVDAEQQTSLLQAWASHASLSQGIQPSTRAAPLPVQHHVLMDNRQMQMTGSKVTQAEAPVNGM